jgi:hypothetical protein
MKTEGRLGRAILKRLGRLQPYPDLADSVGAAVVLSNFPPAASDHPCALAAARTLSTSQRTTTATFFSYGNQGYAFSSSTATLDCLRQPRAPSALDWPARELFLDSRWALGKMLRKVPRAAGPGRGKKKGKQADSFRFLMRALRA